MKNTNTKAFKAQVWQYILESDDSAPSNTSDYDKALHIWERFRSEHNYDNNKRRLPNLQERVADWLSGVALNIAYTNYDIIKLSEKWHDCQLSEKQVEMVLNNWWKFMAFKLIQLVEYHGIDTTKDY